MDLSGTGGLDRLQELLRDRGPAAADPAHRLSHEAGPRASFQPAIHPPAAEQEAGTATDGWDEVCAMMGLSASSVHDLRRRSITNGTEMAAEIVASGIVSEETLARAVAEHAGIAFQRHVDAQKLVMTDAQAAMGLRIRKGLPVARYCMPDAALILVAAFAQSPAELRRRAAREPVASARLRVVSPTTLRHAVGQRAGPSLAEKARLHLFETMPHFSARQVLTGRQGMAIGILATVIAGLLTWHGAVTLLAFHFVLSAFFLANVLLRIVAATHARPLRLRRLVPFEKKSAPVYSVIVALRNEAEIVPELLVALGRLQWPRTKLEIKIVCESDDPATLAALDAHALHPCMERIVVPAQLPRTKPKALAHGLARCTGEFVVLFDAEDRPHPLQLQEAWQVFREQPANVACLQAPLVVTYPGNGAIPLLFGFEYAALFRGLVPWLAARRTVVPLGGTSNHFRRDALEAVGGWDPFNVTEDADLGLRLVRAGYATATITRPTYENPPATLRVWIPQRTRWFKGWIQTWLVHMRRPMVLLRELGMHDFVVTQMLFLGMVVSALAHSVFVATIIYLGVRYFMGLPMPVHHGAIFAIDAFNILGGYAAFLVLGFRTLAPVERRGFWTIVVFTPFYWLAMSVAAWRALYHLAVKPHLWEKTPHSRSRPRRRSATPATAEETGRSCPPGRAG